jgi:uncharacterized glyoxalase superfamily protein PhnB
LGFKVRGEVDAALTHISMIRGEATIMLAPLGNDFGGAWPAAKVADGRPRSGGPILFYIEANDIEADFELAKSKGVTIVDPPGAKPWGQLEFTIADPDGILWALWKVPADASQKA